MVGYQPNAWPYAKYDVEAAKESLAKAGYPNGEGLPELNRHLQHRLRPRKVYALVQADLAAIGIKAEFEGIE